MYLETHHEAHSTGTPEQIREALSKIDVEIFNLRKCKNVILECYCFSFCPQDVHKVAKQYYEENGQNTEMNKIGRISNGCWSGVA